MLKEDVDSFQRLFILLPPYAMKMDGDTWGEYLFMDVSLCRRNSYFWLRGGIFLLFCVFFGGSISVRAADTVERFDENILWFQSAQSFTEKASGAFRSSLEERGILPEESEDDRRFRTFLETLVGEAPIRAMIPALVERDRETAAFLVSIARKESSWGEHAPSKEGGDCFNYWGYKGTGSRGTGMGYACFASPEEAVDTVGNRLSKLIHEKKLNSPERLIVWKCGSSCEGHSPESVSKWISDVRSVYSKFVPEISRADSSDSRYTEVALSL